MPWDAATNVVALTQAVDGPVILLNPGETVACQILRTGVVTDLLLVQTFGTLETTPGSRATIPLFAFSLRNVELSIDFIVRGVFGFQALILNGQAVPTGTLTADLRYRKDGVDLT